MKPMKVLMLSKEYPPNVYGGAGVHVNYLARTLGELMEVEVRCFGDQNSKRDKLRVRGFSGRLDSPDTAGNNRENNEPSVRKARQFNRVLQPMATDLSIVNQPIEADIIHAHTWYTFLAGFLGKQLYDLPLVTTVHSLEPLRPWKREQLGNGYRLSSWMEKTGLENSDRVIAVSRAMKEDIVKYYEVEKKRVEIIYNGIDLNQYQYTEKTHRIEEFGVDPEQPYALFVGRITRQKGIIHFMEAIKHIREDLQIVLCAGAPDTDEIEQEMTSRVNHLQQERGNIIWINQMVDKETVIQLYSQAEVFVCPSIYEPFGIINLEAMACRTPVVASAIGGIKEVVVHGETGLLVEFTPQGEQDNEPADPAAFARGLARGVNTLMDDPELRQQMKDNGRQRVEEKFSWSRIAARTRDLYQELAGL
ncbi:MAG: glycogen synthase [Bacillota bacterium]